MKFKIIAAVVLFSFLALVGSAFAANGYMDEMQLSNQLERKYDQAFCTGIPRFGHHGSFPYETYRVFDCTTTLNGKMCMEWRIQVSPVVKTLRKPNCF